MGSPEFALSFVLLALGLQDTGAHDLAEPNGTVSTRMEDIDREIEGEDRFKFDGFENSGIYLASRHEGCGSRSDQAAVLTGRGLLASMSFMPGSH